MNKYIIFVLSCVASWCCHGGFYGPLELGMTPFQVTQALATYPGVNPPVQSAGFGVENATSLNYTTIKPYGKATCVLKIGYAKEKLCALVLESTEVFNAEDYDVKLKSRYKAFAMMHEQRYGKPLGVVNWPDKKKLPRNNLTPIHIYRMSPEMLVMVGIVRSGEDEFQVAVRFVDEKLLKGSIPPPRQEVLDAWAKVSEFYDLKQADQWILKAMEAMVNKKPDQAFQYFEKAADLGSSRGYWGMSMMYTGGKGVSPDKQAAEECRNKAAEMGFAMSAVEVDRNFVNAMRKLNVSDAEARSALATIMRAAKDNVMSEQYNLGVMYKNGYGVARDLNKAMKYFQAAANSGDKQAMAQLESMK